ncbi:M6 family metalloprotease domain-containing protein [Virgibacillus soli]|uniref:M6 family metalloprotease domain-containing protein n=1 Tax=Paracerasibacillus soli TaxID=480284 RepID=A0ABU5CSF8_9BACI|nr:M6 family metalloprotease domain-containing protein [Virgibacillus soli]MDY0409303.1 M6 family metalloprotease domain-containing protein [Virgibacillus soli]
MKLIKRSFILAISSLLLFSPTVFAAPSGLDSFPDAVDSETWVLPEDMEWDDYQAVPGVNWNEVTAEPERLLKGALVLVDFADQEFISSLPEGSDEAGNPIGSGDIPREELGQFWEDFLNKPQELNHYRTINEYWRENSYGKWGVEIDAFGPYRLDGREFQYGLSYGNQMPPGYQSRNIQTESLNLAQGDLDASGEEFDFVFILHAGYDQSGVWQEFGEMMFQDRDAVTDEFGPPADLGDLPNWAYTRYVPWTSWFAAKSIWSHANIRNGISVQGESDGMGVFAHEFGHIMELLDNYNNPYGEPVSRTYSGPWELMSRGSFNGPGGPHTRWMITPTLGGSAPSHHMLRNKIKQGFLDEDQYLNVERDALADTGPIFADIVARAVPVGEKFGRTGIHGINIEMEDLTPPNSLEDDWRADMQRGAKWYDNYTIEVVDRVGFDSFTPDSGVLMAKTKNAESAPNIWVVDAKDEDISQVDFIRPDGSEAMYSLGDYRQLSDALFKAGTDENVVSEYVDEHNRLHFYILDKQYDDEGVLSYRVSVRHLDGAGDYERGVVAASSQAERAVPGKVATHYFQVTNTGEATDLFRINVNTDAGWETMIQHHVIEVEAGETVEVPVYVKVPEGESAPTILTFTATSETDTEQVATAQDALLSEISAASLQTLVDIFADMEEIEAGAVRPLQTHLTALEQYENKAAHDKVAKHVDGLKVLINHFADNGLITAKASQALEDYADHLIK